MPILAVSGKKQSGKNTTTDYVLRECRAAGVAAAEFSFADPLKRTCIDVLGLTESQAYGSDADKNNPVPHLLWENFPVQTARCLYNERGYVESLRTGPMTAREVLQFWGTEVFRKAYQDVWAQATARRILAWLNAHPGGVALNSDCRFPNEAEAIRWIGGRVLRLTRAIAADTHVSETALDHYDHFDLVLDNRAMSVADQLEALRPVLRDWGVLPATPAEAEIYWSPDLGEDRSYRGHLLGLGDYPAASGRIEDLAFLYELIDIDGEVS